MALVGPPGQGKSTLAAALARFELADDLVPPRFLHALVFATAATLEADLARDLASQLALTVDGFPTAAAAFQAQSPDEVLAGLGPLDQVLGALGLLAHGPPVRLALDGLDQLTPQAAPPVHAALSSLIHNPRLGHVKLVVTTRPDATIPPGAVTHALDQVDQMHLERYLHRRGVPAAMVSAVSRRAAGNWLVTRLLADLAVDGDLPAGQLPVGLHDTYRHELRRVGSDDPVRWETSLRPVLAVLAAAGVGPVLPIALLCAASGQLAGPDEPARVRDVLVQLRGLVVRGAPGTPEEQLGVFHSTFAEYLMSDPEVGIDGPAAHSALVDAIDQLAPADAHDPADPLHRYAAAAEAEHLWAAGRPERVVPTLYCRESHIPAANLARWVAWQARIQDAFGPDHPATLASRLQVADWTGESGDAWKALRLHQEVLAAKERILGPDDPSTLTSRYYVADWTGRSGDARNALRLFRKVLAASERMLGPDHPETLTTRHQIAYWTGESGNARKALRLQREVLAATERMFGSDHPDTLASRHHVAYWTGKSGNAREALRLEREVLAAMERLLGADHPSTLTTRHHVAYWSSRTGDAQETLRLYQEVVAATERVLGPDHPDTLASRHQVAQWTGRSGDAREALRLHQEVLAVKERVLGPDHPSTLTSRHNVTYWKGVVWAGLFRHR